MGDQHEENIPQNPNKSEKTRFVFAPNLPADSEPVQEPVHEPVQQAASVQTRFGMIPPTLANKAPRPLKTGQFRFEGSPEIETDTDNSGLFTTHHEPVYSHSEQKTSKTSEIFSILFFRAFQAIAFFLLFFVLLGLGVYFVFYDSIYPNQAAKSALTSSVSIPPTTVRFFDLVASGRRFAFLVDSTEQMGIQTDASGFRLIKNQLQQSLRDLKEFDYFELLDFPSIFASDTILALVPADTLYLPGAREKIENLQPAGIGDLKKTILEALALKPDTLLLICHSTNVEQLSAEVLEEIEATAGEVKFYAVEVADSIKPLHETPLEKLTQNLRGDYQWLNIQQKTSYPQELSWMQKENYENASILPLTGMLEEDFRFYGDVSRSETQGRSPFGKEIVVQNRSSEGDNSLSSPKQLSLSDSVIHEIETDARIVYMSGLTSIPQNPPMLRVGAENRLALWIEGAKAELPAAEYLIGLCYKNGVRVKSDENKALQCQLKAALQGCQPAMFLVAMEYQIQNENDPTNQNAMSYMRYWVEKGAKLGEPLAQYFWANHFTNTPKERFSWLEKAASQDLPEAQYLLGKCFETGSGTGTDKSVAAVWYEKAAKQGFTDAQIALEKLKNESGE